MRNGDVDWEPVFERDGIRQVMLLETEVLVGDLLEAGWVTDYKDEAYVILVP